MKCPKCNKKVIVLDTINTKKATYRRRYCKNCDYRFNTEEKITTVYFPSRTTLKTIDY